MTKNELRAALKLAGVAHPAKANLATLQELFDALDVVTQDIVAPIDPPVAPPAPATPESPTGNGLKIEKDRPEQNGIKRPSAGGRCRAVWDALDQFLAETGQQPTAKDVREIAADEGWNPNNASIEFYQWRKFHGITGRQPKVEAPAEAASE